jgi:hypothetical protein
MSTQVAELELDQSSAAVIKGAAIACVHDEQILDLDHSMTAARGIACAVLISIPFWLLFGFAIYLLG